MAAATITTDHDEIRLWAEERGGYPALTRAQGAKESSILRIGFPGFSSDGETERISWDEWFRTFDERRLAFLRQEETEDGQVSHFNKLLSQESLERAAPRMRRANGAIQD